MLKNIPSIISPEMMKALLEMGHGDEILLADGNYPCHSVGIPVVRSDGHGIAEILEAVLNFFPLDTFVEGNVILMDNGLIEKPKVWENYENILKKSGEEYRIITLERFKFYDRAKNAFCVIASSETELYANIILKKGVISR